MRTLLICSLVVPASLMAACGGGGGAKSTQELGDKVLAALQAKDFSQIKGLYWTADDALSLCTDIPEDKKSKLAENFAKELASAEKDFAKCLATDWTDAKIVAVEGGETDDPLKGCGDKAMEVKDIVLKIEVAGKTQEVKLNDPAKVGESYYLLEDVRCKAPEVSCGDLFDKISAMSDLPEKEKAMFSGTEESKAKFTSFCEGMKEDPQAKAMLDCAATASTYADVQACEDKIKGGAGEDMGGGAAPTEPAVAAAAVPEPAAAADAGDDPCEKYIQKVTECSEALPDAAREPIKKALDQMRSTVMGQPASAKNPACTAALDAAKKGMSSMCPAVSWD